MNRNLSLPLLRLGGWCALVTVATTFVVHLVSVPADTFEQRLLLPKNSTYLLRNLVVIVHCICVIISMGAIAHARKESKKSDFVTWGAIGFLLFGLLEISRMVLALVYANGLRSAYLQTTDPQLQAHIRYVLEVQWPLVGQVIFILFILAFGAGCLLMGFGIYRKDVRMDAILGCLLILWGVQSFITLANDFFSLGFDAVISTLSVTFQPGVRLFIAFWLLRKHF